MAELEPAAHVNNLYNTTFWALILKGGLSTAEAHAALKVGAFVPVISQMTEASSRAPIQVRSKRLYSASIVSTITHCPNDSGRAVSCIGERLGMWRWLLVL